MPATLDESLLLIDDVDKSVAGGEVEKEEGEMGGVWLANFNMCFGSFY